MACIEKIYSVSALIGNGSCNANCAFCTGKYLRPQAQEHPLYWKNFASAIKLSARHGGWSLSLTSSGEPTKDPESITKALTVYDACAKQGAYFPNVNLFTNGMLFGDAHFCDTYLPLWRSLGLTNIALSIHSVVKAKQAEAYGLSDYPDFSTIVANVEKHGVGVRGTLLLRRGEVDNELAYQNAVDTLITKHHLTNITSWPIGNPDGTPNEFTPSEDGMASIRAWLTRYTKLCHGHVWGGGVFDYNGSILRLTDYVTKHDPDKDFVRQLVVFQDATVAYSWIREGALCMK